MNSGEGLEATVCKNEKSFFLNGFRMFMLRRG